MVFCLFWILGIMHRSWKVSNYLDKKHYNNIHQFLIVAILEAEKIILKILRTQQSLVCEKMKNATFSL